MSRLPTDNSRLTTPPSYWVAIPDAVLFDPELRASDIRVYAVLRRYALRFGEDRVWPSQEHIAINADCHRSSLSQSLALLEERGYIRREAGGFGQCDRITFCSEGDHPWGFSSAPVPRGERKRPRKYKVQVASAPQLSEKTTCGKSQQLVSEKTTTDVGKDNTIREENKREEEKREEGRGRCDFYFDFEIDDNGVEGGSDFGEEGLGVSADAPHAAWVAFCEGARLDISAATGPEERRGREIARELLEEGVGVAEIAACARYLISQHWRTAPLRMSAVASEIGPWRMAGRPERAERPERAAPSPHTTYRSQAEINAATGKLVL